LIAFENSLPTGFWKAIEKNVKTIVVAKKGIAIGSKVIYDTQLIFSRVLMCNSDSFV